MRMGGPFPDGSSDVQLTRHTASFCSETAIRLRIHLIRSYCCHCAYRTPTHGKAKDSLLYSKVMELFNDPEDHDGNIWDVHACE